MNSLIFKILRYSGIAWLWREIVQRRKTTLLLFHDMTIEDATRNFTYLRKHYTIISLQQYIKAVQTASPLPPKALIITFDDGHYSNRTLLPLLQQEAIPVTIFLCASIVGTHRHFWFRHSNEVKPLVEPLKKISNTDRLLQLANFGYFQQEEYADQQALSQDDITAMKDSVDFQSHTCFHPILPQCDNSTAQAEIAESKRQLEQQYHLTINTLSYPNGDYSDRDIQIAKNAGYSCGITVDAGYNDLRSDLFRLKRFSVNDAHTTDELMVKATGLYALIKHKLHPPTYGYKPSPLQ